jgi:hypothetical protein
VILKVVQALVRTRYVNLAATFVATNAKSVLSEAYNFKAIACGLRAHGLEAMMLAYLSP